MPISERVVQPSPPPGQLSHHCGKVSSRSALHSVGMTENRFEKAAPFLRTIRCNALTLFFTVALCVCGESAAGAPLTLQEQRWAADVSELEGRAASIDRSIEADPKTRSSTQADLRSVGEAAAALRQELREPISQAQERIAQLGDDANNSEDQALKDRALSLQSGLRALEDLDRRVALVALSTEQELASFAQAEAIALGQELFTKSASPFSKQLWEPVIETAPTVVRALAPRATAVASADAVETRLAHRVTALCIWLLLIALLYAGAALLRRVVEFWALRCDAETRPFANSAASVAMLISFVAPAVQAMTSMETMLAPWRLSPAFQALLISTATGSLLALLVVGLARATIQPGKPALSLVQIKPATAKQIWRASIWLGFAMGIGASCERFVTLLALPANVSLPLKGLTAFCSVSMVLVALLLLRRARRERPAAADDGEQLDPFDLCIGAAWILCLTILLGGAFGYIVLANWIAQWFVWAAVVGASAFFMATIADRSVRYGLEVKRARRRGQASTPRRIRQLSVILTAAIQTIIVLLACGALFMPFGAGFTSALGLAAKLAAGIQIGEIKISAGSLLIGLLVFSAVTFLLKLFKAWLEKSYLPTTRLAPDARDSITTIVGYLGTAAAILWALAAAGVGVDKLAILASALSVGIGFGLQAITQNFVSGLILLIERPIKLGDRIKIGDSEGTVKKVSVRSTVIRLVDQSSMIVPNSELITKPVQNLSMQFARPELRLVVSVDAANDVLESIRIIRTFLEGDEQVLTTPPAESELRSIDDSKAVVHCHVYLKPKADPVDTRMRLILSIRQGLTDASISSTIS